MKGISCELYIIQAIISGIYLDLLIMEIAKKSQKKVQINGME
jgi:hypothetical protein